MNSYQPYYEAFRRAWDFRVAYKFLPLASEVRYNSVLTEAESHRLIYQGIKFNFRYLNEGEFKHSHHIISYDLNLKIRAVF